VSETHIKDPRRYESYCGISKSNMIHASYDQKCYKDHEKYVEMWEDISKATCLRCQENCNAHLSAVLCTNKMTMNQKRS